MATISTSIKLVDNMSPTLRAANNGLHMLIKSFNMARATMARGLGNGGITINANLAGVVNKLSAIESGVARVNQNIRKTHRGIGHVVNQGVHANSTLGKMNTILDASTNKQGRLAVATSRVRSAINANKIAQDGHNKSIQRGDSLMTGLYRKVRNIAMVYGGIQGGLKVLGTADELTRTEARFNLMTGGDKAATAALQESTYQSAMRSRSDYLGTASTVAKLGQRAPGLFKSNDDTVQFVENLNKAYKIAGATEQEMWASTLQLSQGLGAGALRGEEFRSVFEAAPNLIRIIAEEMGQPVGKMKDLAAEGELTSEVIRDALLNATDKINKQFANLPYTWADVWTTMKNVTLRASQPILKLISRLTQSKRFINFLGGIERGIRWIINMISRLGRAVKPTLIDIYDSLEDVYNHLGKKWGLITETFQNIMGALGDFTRYLVKLVVPAVIKVYNAIKKVYDFVKRNWSWIAPIVWKIVGAFLTYKACLIAVYTWTKLVAVASAIWGAIKVAVGLAAGMLWVFTGAAWAQQVAQWGMNAAMYACPLTWFVLGLIAVIAAVYAVVAVINEFAGTSISATGIVLFAFVALGTAITNAFAMLWNVVAAFAEFLTNVFDHPIYSVKALFVNLVDNFLKYVISMTKGWDEFATAIANAFITAINAVIGAWNNLVDALPEKVTDVLGMEKWGKLESRVSITSDLEQARANLKDWLGDPPKGYDKAFKFEYDTVGENLVNAYLKGEEIEKKFKELKEKLKSGEYIEKLEEFIKKLTSTDGDKHVFSGTDAQDYINAANDARDKAANDTSKALNGIGKDVKGISNSLNVSDDERKYLYTIAEREAINQMTRNEIKVTMTNNNTMNNGTDAKSTMDYLARQLAGQLQSSQEGLAY